METPLSNNSRRSSICSADTDSDFAMPNQDVPVSSSHLPFRKSAGSSSSSWNGLVGIIDEGSSSVTFCIYSTPDFKEIAAHQMQLPLITPKDGWFEQDPVAIINIVYHCAHMAVRKLADLGFSKDDILTIGITNQRETTIAWDSITGKPLYNAIGWNDIRATATVDSILAHLPDESKNSFMNTCGLPISPYFSALKIRWLMDNVPAVSKACRKKRCRFGTVDSWIVWNLTKGSLHITDVTNASRTLLMNIETLQWDALLLKTFDIPNEMLPQIRSCSEIYGKVTDNRFVLENINISCIIGNQQASLLGQMCVKPGQTKNTYRSGCFLLRNIGVRPIISQYGLLTTVAYKLGPQAETFYALEGAVAVAGHALDWLENKVRILPNASDAEKSASIVPNTGEVYFVPAFTGLYAPYWRKDARGIIIGLTQFSNKHHLVRAVIESICFQTRDILECMYKEANFEFNKLHADGPLSSNNLLMQLQADIAGVPVCRSQLADTTSFGAAMCAAQADGIDLCKFNHKKRQLESSPYDIFLPTSTENERNLRYTKWKKAVERSFNWANSTKSKGIIEEGVRILHSIPLTLFVFISFAMFVHSMNRK